MDEEEESRQEKKRKTDKVEQIDTYPSPPRENINPNLPNPSSPSVTHSPQPSTPVVNVVQASPQKQLHRLRKAVAPHNEEVQKRLSKALSERMRVTDEKVIRCTGFNMERQYTIIANSGKPYVVTINTRPNCTCPDNLGGKNPSHCKHIVRTLHF